MGRHLAAMTWEGILEASGKTRNRRYSLANYGKSVRLRLAENRDEDHVWRAHVAPDLARHPDNVLRICQYGFTEMFNNAIDHSGGRSRDDAHWIRPARSASPRISRNRAR